MRTLLFLFLIASNTADYHRKKAGYKAININF